MSNERIHLKTPQVTEALLNATGSLVRQFGYRKTSMEDLATLAGVSRATAYLYFPNKEAMVVAWIERQVQKRKATLLAIGAAEPDPVKRIRKMLLGRIEFSLDKAKDWGPHLEELLSVVRLAPEAWHQQLLSDEASLLTESLTDARFLCPVSPQATAELLCMATHGLLQAKIGKHRLEDNLELRAQAEQLVDLLLRGVLR